VEVVGDEQHDQGSVEVEVVMVMMAVAVAVGASQ
jgi:hypothetical protein